jgi:hypothetical protein
MDSSSAFLLSALVGFTCVSNLGSENFCRIVFTTFFTGYTDDNEVQVVHDPQFLLPIISTSTSTNI